MITEDTVMVIDKPHFQVKLYKTLLEVDLKKGVKKELEDVLEAKPTLRENLGFIFQTIIPLDVRLRDIESVQVDKKGQVKVAIPHRRDVVIPLEPNESRRLVDKMNELIPIEKERAVRELQESEEARKALELRLATRESKIYRARTR